MRPDAPAARAGQTASGPRIVAYTAGTRIVTAVLVAAGALSVPGLVVWALRMPIPVPLFAWFRGLAAFTVAPWLAAWLLQRRLAVRLDIGAGELLAEGSGVRIAVPLASIRGIEPWRVPLPAAGAWVRLRSGQRLVYGFQVSDPVALLEWLTPVFSAASAAAARHPTTAYAHAKHAWRRRWYHSIGKFPVFALGPTALWFNLHQHITYGGLFGQYYAEGLEPFLRAWSILWGLTTIYLLLYAGLLRWVVEAAALLGAWLAPARAGGVRAAAEIVAAAAYYGGIPLLLLWRFLQ